MLVSSCWSTIQMRNSSSSLITICLCWSRNSMHKEKLSGIMSALGLICSQHSTSSRLVGSPLGVWAAWMRSVSCPRQWTLHSWKSWTKCGQQSCNQERNHIPDGTSMKLHSSNRASLFSTTLARSSTAWMVGWRKTRTCWLTIWQGYSLSLPSDTSLYYLQSMVTQFRMFQTWSMHWLWVRNEASRRELSTVVQRHKEQFSGLMTQLQAIQPQWQEAWSGQCTSDPWPAMLQWCSWRYSNSTAWLPQLPPIHQVLSAVWSPHSWNHSPWLHGWLYSLLMHGYLRTYPTT